MKLSLSQLKTIWKHPVPSLGAVLGIAWWVILGVFAALLFLDGFMFYQFGLGYGIEPLSGEIDGPALIRLREDTLRAAAAQIEERLARFNAEGAPATDIPDPFR